MYLKIFCLTAAASHPLLILFKALTIDNHWIAGSVISCGYLECRRLLVTGYSISKMHKSTENQHENRD